MWRSTNWERKGWMTASRFVLILRNSERNNQITPQFKIIAPQLLSHGHPPSSQIGLISTQSFFKIFSQTFGNALYFIFFLMIINHFFQITSDVFSFLPTNVFSIFCFLLECWTFRGRRPPVAQCRKSSSWCLDQPSIRGRALSFANFNSVEDHRDQLN